MPTRQLTPPLLTRPFLLPLPLETNRTSPLVLLLRIPREHPRHRLQAHDSPHDAGPAFLDMVNATSEAVEEEVGREGEGGVRGEEERERDELEEGEGRGEHVGEEGEEPGGREGDARGSGVLRVARGRGGGRGIGGAGDFLFLRGTG